MDICAFKTATAMAQLEQDEKLGDKRLQVLNSSGLVPHRPHALHTIL
jgi:hypothetical protein